MTKLSERDNLICIISDTYKDINGCRPSLEWTRTATTEELQAEADRLCDWLEDEIERERAEWAQEEENRLAREADEDPETITFEPETFPTAGDGWAFTPAC